jgi:hypothetical protein
MMLAYDPVPWLMKQEGLSAVRARRWLGLDRAGDAEAARDWARQVLVDETVAGPMKSAGVLSTLADLRMLDVPVAFVVADRLFEVLQSQPGYESAREIVPGSLRTPCDLGGFFGPYEARKRPEVMAFGAQEMNDYRQYEPLMGPRSPVRPVPRSSLDRAGPSSCYSWGLIPLSTMVEVLCKAGYAGDDRLQPAIKALLGAQRKSGGWCRNLGGHPNCSLHAIRALGAHPMLRQSEYAVRALRLLLERGQRLNRFALLQTVASFDLPASRELICNLLGQIAPRQRKNGSFGTPHPVERVAAVLMALHVLKKE